MKKPRNSPAAIIRISESGNVFLALFGAVAIVGVLGATIMSVMRGPLSTMVEVNRREQAKSEVSLAANLVLAAAADTDAVPDGYTEAPPFAAGTITGGGVIPMTVGAAKTDPWGTPYAYCVWNHGPDMAGYTGMANTLNGNVDTNNTAIAIISAGPDRTFQTSCIADDGDDLVGTDYVEPDDGGGDDIVKALSYNDAVGATDGLWTAVGVTEASIDRNLTVTSTDTSTFTGSIAVASSAAIITDSIEPIDPATIDYVTFSNGIRLGDVPLATSCDAAGDAGTLRFNGGNLEMCNGVAWTGVGGDLWTDLTGGRIHYGSAGTEQVGIGTNNPNNTLDVAGTLDASGAVTFGSTLGVTGNVAVNTNMFTIDATNGNTLVAGTLDSTGDFAVNTNQFTVNATNGNTLVAGTLDSTGNFAVNTNRFTVDASNGDTLVDGQLTVNADAEITDSLLITSDTADGSTNPLEIDDSGNSQVFRVDSNGGILGEGLLDINGGAQIDPQLTITSDTADGSGDPLVIRDSASSVVFDIDSNGNADAAGTIEANDYTWAGNDFTPATCAGGNFNRWDGTAWVCEADTDGGYVAPPPTPGGANTQVQFNNAGVLDGDAGMTWNDTSKIFATQNATVFPQNTGLPVSDLSFVFEHVRQTPNGIRLSGVDTSAALKNTIISYADGGAVGLGTGNLSSTVLDSGIGFFGTQIFIDSLTQGGFPGVAFGESGGSNGNLLLLTHDSTSADTDTFYFHTTKVANASFRPHLQIGGRSLVFRTGLNGNPFLNPIIMTMTETGNVGIGDETPDSGTGGQLKLDVEGSIGGTQYCDENGNNCFEATDVSGGGATVIDDLTDAYTIYDAGTTSNFIMGRAGAGALADDAAQNLFIGELAGATTANSTSATYRNVAIGFRALSNLTSGNNNIAVGVNALISNTTGYNNTATGTTALSSNTTGNSNVANGVGALSVNSTGNYNIAIGTSALANSATGLNNIALGSSTGSTLTTGSNNILIGDSVDVPTAGTNEYLNIGGILLGDIGTTSTDPKIGAHKYCDENLANCFEATDVGAVAATTINDLTDAYTIYDAGTTSNFIMGRTGAAALTAGAARNMFIGELAGTTTGTAATDHNLAIGYRSLASLTSGYENTAVGFESMAATSTGVQSSAFGAYALMSNTSGNGNAAFGNSALASNTSGFANTAVGGIALGSNTTAAWNTGIGYAALFANTTGTRNSALGTSAMQSNTTGSDNTASGFNALTANTTGASNVAIGANALFSNTSGADNVAIGRQAMNFSTTGSSNSAVGLQSLQFNTTGASNVAMGVNSLAENRAKSRSTAIGFEAMRYADSTVTPGNANNTAVGYQALMGSTTAANNTGTENTAIGYQAMLNNTSGSFNASLGIGSLRANTTGTHNTASGTYAMQSNTTGTFNTSLGYAALAFNTTGGSNTAVGQQALFSSTISNNNTALGGAALYSNTTGNQNTAIGGSAGSTLTTGSNNILIGYNVNTPAAGTNEYLNIGNILFGDIGTTSTDPKIGAHKYCDENLANCFEASAVGAGGGALSGLTDAVADNTLTNAAWNQIWNWQLTGAETGLAFGETAASAGGGTANQHIVSASTLASSTAIPLYIRNLGEGRSFQVDDEAGDTTPFYIGGDGITHFSNNVFFNFPGGFSAYIAAGNMFSGDDFGLYESGGDGAMAVFDPTEGLFRYANGLLSMNTSSGVMIGTTTQSSGDQTLELDVHGDIGADNYCDKDGNNCFTPSGIATNINGLSDAYTIYDAGTTSNFIMGRTSAAALTAGAIQNLFIGENAGATTANSTAATDHNIAIGYNALNGLTSGDSNLAVGSSALAANTNGTGNIALGRNALTGNTSGSDNIAIGPSALAANDGTNNIALGNSALYSNTSGQDNIAIGNSAMGMNTTTSYNVAIGTNVLASNSGFYNIGIGWLALQANDGGNWNLGIGAEALNGNTSGSANIGIGYRAIWGNETGNDNTAMGLSAMGANTSGNNNTALGREALSSNEISSNNVAIGRSALLSTTGATNTAVGTYAGDSLTTGSGNILIGYNVDAPAAGSSNRLNIGDSIYGDLSNDYIGIGNASPSVALDVTGDIEYTGTITDLSDARLKKDIAPLDNMLAKIGAVKTYSFVMKDDPKAKTEFGVLAQEIETVFPELVKTADDEMGTKSVNYVGLIAPMIDSIQTLKAENEVLKTKVATLENQTTQSLAEMQKQIDVLNKTASASVKKAGFAFDNWIAVLGLGIMGFACFILGRRTIRKPS